LKIVHLRGVGEQRRARRHAHARDRQGRLANRRRGKEFVVAVAENHVGGLELEIGRGVVERRAQPHRADLDVGMQRADGEVEGPLAFARARARRLKPAEPPQLAAVGVGGHRVKAAPAVVAPVQLGRHAQLPQVAHTVRVPGRRFAAAQRRQQQRPEHRDDGDDHQQLHERERARGSGSEPRCSAHAHGNRACTR